MEIMERRTETAWNWYRVNLWDGENWFPFKFMFPSMISLGGNQIWSLFMGILETFSSENDFLMLRCHSNSALRKKLIFIDFTSFSFRARCNKLCLESIYSHHHRQLTSVLKVENGITSGRVWRLQELSYSFENESNYCLVLALRSRNSER